MNPNVDSHDLIDAAERGDLTGAARLLEAGANPNVRHVLHRCTPLLVAATRGHLEMVKLLARHGAAFTRAVGDAPTTPIEAAAVAGRLEVVAWLLQAGTTVPDGPAGDELIAEVLGYGEAEIAELLKRSRERSKG